VRRTFENSCGTGQNCEHPFLVAIERRKSTGNSITKCLATRILTCSPAALAVLLCLLVNLPLPAQQAPPITVDVNAISLFATVHDKHGNIVRDLGKDDFTLEQDGKPQRLTYFAKESNLPLTLGLLVDVSMSQRRVLDQELRASHSFLDHILRQGQDQAFIIQFAREVELVQDLTSSRQELQSAIDKINAPEFSQSSSGNTDDRGHGGRGTKRRRGGTLLYDAVYLASEEVLKKPQGRKAVIVLTDGVDRGSKESLLQAIEAAQRSDTLVYGILFADKEESGNRGGFGGPRMGGRGGTYPRRTEESRPDGKKVLEQICKSTGGRFFEVSKKETIENIYASIDEELRNQYSLGYTANKADTPPGYHKIHLAVKQKDGTVQTRDGFYMDR
jgi:VWFA-related protein